MAKRGERVAPPPVPGGWDLRFGNSDAGKGWEELRAQASAALRRAYDEILADPTPNPPTERHHQLRRELAFGKHDGRDMPRWQIDVTGAARIWYLVDDEQRTLWVYWAGTGHPPATDKGNVRRR